MIPSLSWSLSLSVVICERIPFTAFCDLDDWMAMGRSPLETGAIQLSGKHQRYNRIRLNRAFKALWLYVYNN